uniref:Acyltransferase 3 domain-containing protein n=2 Tax=Graphocephala atropunctata TaxID=36148 RepID=A0A1B6MUK0_9HEMI
MMFSYSLAVYLTRGPIWTRMVGSFETPCEQYWWTGLLHISNYVNPDATCVSHSWYLACDFQLNIIAPLFLILLQKRPKIGWILLGVCIAASVVGATVNAYLRELGSGFMLSEFTSSRNSDLSYPIDHKGIHYRISTFLMGIGLGYLVFTVKQNKANQNISKVLWQVGWVVSTSILAAVVAVTVVMVDPDHKFCPWLDPLFVGLSRPLFCISLSWVILACTLGYGGFLNQFLSWSGFRPLARLTYGVYLVHYLGFTKQLYGMQVPLTFSFIDYVYLLGGDLVVSFTIAAALYVTVETPCCRLATYFLKGKKKRDSIDETHQMSDFRTSTKGSEQQQNN